MSSARVIKKVLKKFPKIDLLHPEKTPDAKEIQQEFAKAFQKITPAEKKRFELMENIKNALLAEKSEYYAKNPMELVTDMAKLGLSVEEQRPFMRYRMLMRANEIFAALGDEAKLEEIRNKPRMFGLPESVLASDTETVLKRELQGILTFVFNSYLTHIKNDERLHDSFLSKVGESEVQSAAFASHHADTSEAKRDQECVVMLARVRAVLGDELSDTVKIRLEKKDGKDYVVMGKVYPKQENDKVNQKIITKLTKEIIIPLKARGIYSEWEETDKSTYRVIIPVKQPSPSEVAKEQKAVTVDFLQSHQAAVTPPSALPSVTPAAAPATPQERRSLTRAFSTSG